MSARLSSLPGSSENATRIQHPRKLFAARFFLILFLVLSLLFGISNVPSNFEFAYRHLTPYITSFHDLTTLGISIELGVLYSWLTVLMGQVILIIAALITAWYRSDDWLAILAAVMLISAAVPRGFGSDMRLYLDVLIS